MSVPEHSRFDELLSRYLDASLSDAEEHELLHYLADENLAARFHEATQLDTEIAGVLAGSIPDEAMVGLVWSDLALPGRAPRGEKADEVRARASRKSRKIVLLALAAAILGLLVVSTVYFSRSTAPVVAHSTPMPTPTPAPAPTPEVRGQIIAVQGEVYFNSASGRVLLSGDKAVTEAGKIETVGPDSRASLMLTDGTRIELMGNTSFDTELDPAKRRLFLGKGILRAVVAKQPANNPLIFQTPYASAIVHGTTLALVARRDDVYLVVFEGVVGLKRGSDEPEVQVETGRYLHVETSEGSVTWPIGRLPLAVKQSLQQ